MTQIRARTDANLREMRLFALVLDEILRITYLTGAPLDDVLELYAPSASSSVEQLIVEFDEPKPEKRPKRQRFGDSDDSSDDEYMVRSEEKKRRFYICSRCGSKFEKMDAICSYHPGTFSVLMTDSVLEIPSNSAVAVDGDYEQGLHTRLETVREWTCCKQRSVLSGGCTSGTHAINHLADASLDQKLVSLFSSNAALETPAIATIAPAEAPAPPNAANDDDDDVQIIGRGQLFGNDNPQGTVSLNRIFHNNKCFCLNESLDHPLSSILFAGGAGITYLESDCDAELIITVGFTSNVKLMLIRLSVLNLPQAPANIKIYINKAGRINFDNVSSTKHDQEILLEESSFQDNIAVLQLSPAKFHMVESVTLYISSNLGNIDTTVLSTLSFIGVAKHVH